MSYLFWNRGSSSDASRSRQGQSPSLAHAAGAKVHRKSKSPPRNHASFISSVSSLRHSFCNAWASIFLLWKTYTPGPILPAPRDTPPPIQMHPKVWRFALLVILQNLPRTRGYSATDIKQTIGGKEISVANLPSKASDW